MTRIEARERADSLPERTPTKAVAWRGHPAGRQVQADQTRGQTAAREGRVEVVSRPAWPNYPAIGPVDAYG
jgi:hypothetical protein